MKKAMIVLLMGLMSSGTVFSEETSAAKNGVSPMQGAISERIESFMLALNIPSGSDKQLPDVSQGSLSKENLRKVGALEVRRGKERRLGTNSVAMVVDFLDDKKIRVGSADIMCEASARAAQSALFKKLVMNSLPIDVVVARYSVKKDGPGDFCLVEKNYNREKKLYVPNESMIHIIRGGVAMSICVEGTSLRAEDLAKLLDEELLREPK